MNLINWQNLITKLNKTTMDTFQNNINEGKVDKSSVLSGQDLNNVVDTAFFYCSACTNRPTSANGWLVVIKYTNTYSKQIYFPVNENRGYERTCVNSTWSNWDVIGAETKYSLATYLENDWESNGENVASVLPNGTKILTVSVRRGTSTNVMTLPSDLRPSGTVLVQATNGSAVGLVTIATNGTVTVANSIFTSGSSNCVFSVMYE